ncbi:uncharacterized protein SETTUDRAFT_166804 [Exserohilum turcica Et28A]|uniref:Uncharacterized protein n=1 Tax=Exserohilum turcicum (strain 28A) TaxID=671987 RepID=R0J2C4_EXST2|nr:uncharacterized protein SETTUDRAFT_166804 [Exserohilum turcica Et28A]EOA90916.1 hypothetical protein SETTUDRAFT_166804 [Exserohilum turcica Et28A]
MCGVGVAVVCKQLPLLCLLAGGRAGLLAWVNRPARLKINPGCFVTPQMHRSVGVTVASAAAVDSDSTRISRTRSRPHPLAHPLLAQG